MNEELVWRLRCGALSFFYCHIRKVIFSIVEEHSCICSTVNSQWNRPEAVLFSLQQPGSCNQQNKGPNIQTLQNRVVMEIIVTSQNCEICNCPAPYITKRKAIER